MLIIHTLVLYDIANACARSCTEGKGAGYLFYSPEVPGTGGLRMFSNNSLLLDNGGRSSCMQKILTMKLAKTIDLVLSDLVNFEKDSSVCLSCLHVCTCVNSHPCCM